MWPVRGPSTDLPPLSLAAGLVVLLHHQLTMRMGLGDHGYTVHLPVRKRVECRTRDLHQSLIHKLSRAISRAAGDQLDSTTGRLAQRLASLNPVSATAWSCLSLYAKQASFSINPAQCSPMSALQCTTPLQESALA